MNPDLIQKAFAVVARQRHRVVLSTHAPYLQARDAHLFSNREHLVEWHAERRFGDSDLSVSQVVLVLSSST
jgi:hypothetical protein